MPSTRKIVITAIGTQLIRERVTLMAVLLLGVMGSCGHALAQQQESAKAHFGGPPVVAFTLNLERAQIANVGCGCFWLQGGSTDIAVPIYRGWSVAGTFGGGTASNIHQGANLSKLSYLGGPRYTFNTSHFAGVPNGPRIFGEALFGGAHAFNSTFPAVGAAPTTANSYAMQFGGGIDLLLSKGIGVRLIEADYVRTAFSNNGSNTQNDLRLAFGMSYHFGVQ
jgi:hypothetical protein